MEYIYFLGNEVLRENESSFLNKLMQEIPVVSGIELEEALDKFRNGVDFKTVVQELNYATVAV